jgi:hypothetical protein
MKSKLKLQKSMETVINTDLFVWNITQNDKKQNSLQLVYEYC